MKLKISQYAKLEGVKYRAIWNRIKRGKLQIERTSTGSILVVFDENKETRIAVYCRVSSAENKDNLEKQKERVLSYCYAKGYQIERVICEIGSGLDDGRSELEKLLSDITITKIVVEHSDRFSHFGLNYIQKLLALQGRSVEIINKQDDDRNELMQDFVSIITSFTARLYGLRRSKRKTEQIIKELETKRD